MEFGAVKPLRDFPEEAEKAAGWFHEKWGVPRKEYLESIRECIRKRSGIPQWYVITDEQGEIAAGAGLIENDFHQRPDLTPNLCALFVEEPKRGRGIARALLQFIRDDAGSMGIPRLYLITDHTAFYEKCGWEFLTMVTENEGGQVRMYTAQT